MIRQEFYSNNEFKLNYGYYGEFITDYENGYICDAFIEIADNNVDIYISQLFKWVYNDHDSLEYMERVRAERLIDFNDYSFTRHIIAAQYEQINDDLLEHSDDIIKLFIVDYIDHMDLSEPEKQKLFDNIDEYDTCDRLDSIIDDIEELKSELFGGIEQ